MRPPFFNSSVTLLGNMKLSSTIQTILSRFLMLGLNFGLIVLTTNIWGSEGRGVIALLLADLAIVIFATNIFAGSAVSYFSTKFSTTAILKYSYLWSLLAGMLVPLFLSVFHKMDYLLYLLVLSVLSSLLSANTNMFIGLRKIKSFNVYTILQFALHVLFVLILVFILDLKNIGVYFIAQIAALALLTITSTAQILNNKSTVFDTKSKALPFLMFQYGWKTQLSGFIQFLNNRLSFYFLESIRGLSSVGVFSVGIAFSEAIWAVSRSLAVVLYSDLVNSTDEVQNIYQTKVSLKLCFLLTIFFIVLIMMIPDHFYSVVFGKDFSHTRLIVLWLAPGILAVAVSNIIGHYFSAMNKLRILNVKSFLGLAVIVPACMYAIPRWGLQGAAVATTFSYCLSSAVLIRSFYRITDFKLSDYLITRADVQLLTSKFKK